MGLLHYDSKTTLDYHDSKKFQWKLKQIAIEQFLRLYIKFADFKPEDGKYRKYGYEIETNTFKIETSPKGKVNYLLQTDLGFISQMKSPSFEVHSELGAWMAELVPKTPMAEYMGSRSLKEDLEMLYSSLMQFSESTPNRFLSLPFFPKLGSIYMLRDLEIAEFPQEEISGEELIISKNDPLDDKIISKHPRYQALFQNTHQRRQEKPPMVLKIFKDEETNLKQIIPGERKPGEVYFESYAMGLGLCSLQVTVGCDSIHQSRWIHDQYHMFTPIFVISPLTVVCSQCFDANRKKYAS